MFTFEQKLHQKEIMSPLNVKPSLLGKRRPVGSGEYIVDVIKLLQIGPSEIDSLWNKFVFVFISLVELHFCMGWYNRKAGALLSLKSIRLDRYLDIWCQRFCCLRHLSNTSLLTSLFKT